MPDSEEQADDVTGEISLTNAQCSQHEAGACASSRKLPPLQVTPGISERSCAAHQAEC